MRHKLQVISKSWHRKQTSKDKQHKYFKTSQSPEHNKKFLRLNCKRGHEKDNEPKTQQHIEHPFDDKEIQKQNKYKQIAYKLSLFIRKIQETIKKILYHKDVKKYLEYLKTSESEIIDNFNRALDKFRAILYHLRECQGVNISKESSKVLLTAKGKSESNLRKDLKQNYDEDKRRCQFADINQNSHKNNKNNDQKQLNSCSESSSSSYLYFHQKDRLNQNQKSTLNQKSNNSNHHQDHTAEINYDVLSFLLQYFEQHMIPETHWSLKEQFRNSLGYNYTGILSRYLPSFKLNTCRQANTTQTVLQTLPQLQITKTVSNIMGEINKEEFQNAQNSHTAQKFIPKPVEETLNAILKLQQLKPIQTMTSTQKIAYLLELQSKIFVSGEFIQSAAFFVDDITTLPKSQYQNVWQYVHENSIGDQEMISQQYKLMKMLMIITNASVIRQLQTQSAENSWFKKLIFGLSFPRYFFDYSQAKLQNHKFLRKPNVLTIKSIWNLPENGFIKELKKPLIFDYIPTNIEFYVQRTKSRHLRNFKNKVINQNKDIFVPNQNSFKIRLLNSKQLEVKGRHHTYSSQIYQTIIIHYHGGGFIALSSCTSQSYTRKWANSLKVPVFSVDYGKPPEFRFPTPVLDCLDAYIFITQHISKFFPQIRPKKVIVAGDSAGGNLACSLTGLALKLQLKIPYGLMLAYPAVDTRKKFSPSRINSYNDVILYPTLLLLCMQQYLGSQQQQNNPLASPILLTQDFVKQNDSKQWPSNWPKTIIMVGKKDPLFDDSLRLCDKLASANVQFHCEIYKYLTHAFLSIDKMVPQCVKTIQDSIKLFEKLISGQKIGVGKLI